MKFNDCAGQYEAHAHVQKCVAAWSAGWLDEPTADLTALELGAGTGLFTRHLAEKDFSSLAATDISRAMLCRGVRNVPTIEWSLLDAWCPSRLEPRDRLYSSSLLQWAKAPRAVLERWTLLLKPNGRLLATFFIEGSLVELFPTSSSLAALTWRSAKEWLSLFRDAGWRVRRHRIWRQTELFPTAAAALRSVHQTGAVEAGRATVAQLRRVLTDCNAAYRTPSGGVPLTWKAMQIEAGPTPRSYPLESSR